MAGKNHISSPLVLKGNVDPTVAPGAAAPIGCLFQHEADGRLWTKVGVLDTAWSQFAYTAAARGAILTFGADGIGGAADARYLPAGHDMGVASLINSLQVPLPRAGELRNLAVSHNSNGGNGANVTYTVVVNGVLTALTATLATGAIGVAFDLINTVAVAQGDLVTVQAAKAAPIGAGNIGPQVSVEVV
jgi:hypothetical protein